VSVDPWCGRRPGAWAIVLSLGCVGCFFLQAFPGGVCPAAEPTSDYERVIAGRADKILATLDLAEAAPRDRVREALLDFYRSVSSWHDAHAADRTSLRSSQVDAAKEKLAALDAELATLRTAFLDRVAPDLSPEHLAAIKDGLTFNVLNVTERAYHDMIPTLKDEQKTRIRDWLVEAREVAISEGSAEAKHAVFGTYKGRINNFLSQQGYDLKQEERGWQDRRKAAAAREATTAPEFP
jgi:hypothetical protein